MSSEDKPSVTIYGEIVPFNGIKVSELKEYLAPYRNKYPFINLNTRKKQLIEYVNEVTRREALKTTRPKLTKKEREKEQERKTRHETFNIFTDKDIFRFLPLSEKELALSAMENFLSRMPIESRRNFYFDLAQHYRSNVSRFEKSVMQLSEKYDYVMIRYSKAVLEGILEKIPRYERHIIWIISMYLEGAFKGAILGIYADLRRNEFLNSSFFMPSKSQTIR